MGGSSDICLSWDQLDEAIPAYLSLVLIPLTFSITQGIIWGFLAYTVVKIASGKAREMSPVLLAIDVLAIAAVLMT